MFAYYRRPLVAALVLVAALSGCGVASVPSGAGSSPSAVAQQPTTVAQQPTTVAQQPTAAPSESGAPSPQPGTDSATAPVQAVLDYYDAINQKHYEQAYRYWADDGAASNQSLEQFTQGFADTVSVSVLLNTPKTGQGASAGGVTVPVAIFSVLNAPNSPTSGQAVRGFGGTYTLVPAAGSATGWQIASADIRELPEGASIGQDYDDPARLVQAYYDAIDTHDLARAYTDWDNNGQASQQSYAQFAQGFANTRQVAVELGQPQSGAGAGNLYATVPIIINATNNDGTQQTFCGSYQLHRANIPPWDALGWRLQSAQIAPHEAVQLGTDQSRQLLSSGCQ